MRKTLLCLLFSLAAVAEEPDERGQLYIFGVNGTIELYQFNKETEEEGVGLSRASQVFLGAQTGNLSVSLGMDIYRVFERYGFDIDPDFEMESFLSKATVTIQDIDDNLVAVIVGKQIIPFGQRFISRPLPFSWDNEIEDVRSIRGVLGLSAKISDLPSLQGIVDDVELSVFESSSHDLDVKGGVGGSIRLTKLVETDEHEHEISVSYAKRENRHLQYRQGVEERLSLGVITESPYSDDILWWGNGVYFKNNKFFRNTGKTLLSTGVVYKPFEGKYLSGEFTWMDKFRKSYAAAIWFELLQQEGFNSMLGFEYRHYDYDNDTLFEDDNQIGVNLRIKFYKVRGIRIKERFFSGQ